VTSILHCGAGLHSKPNIIYYKNLFCFFNSFYALKQKRTDCSSEKVRSQEAQLLHLFQHTRDFHLIQHEKD
jgi:hypothetical protein